ncbi:hypothetical protein SAY87_007819 [Trapa incisa]|uniref:Uncharacterized protein n=1 Tax=Trapa incisa TaxID=236973 RepID=A0AAN7KNQ2_9MYRT|nr:hypothetical protein SAY87_007819 [Trapa incisa]
MQNCNQDQRSSGIEDTSMTIEFLRARLLSERSVSKSARQRADELAERVAELEEQLRIVSLQRKKAEKAAVDVLAILETHGVNEISDSYYSSSDQEPTPCVQKLRGSDPKNSEGSANSVGRDSELEKFSSPELEPSTTTGRRIPWKGRRDHPSHSVEKFKDSPIRRRSSFACVGLSSKQQLGKSCRQIKQRSEASTDLEDNSSLRIHSQNNVDESDTKMEISRVDSEPQKGKTTPDAAVSRQLRDEFGADGDMKRALENQAQLIGQYKDMEKEQREWEEKYRENNSSTVESCDPGNNSDITEEREEINSESPSSHQRVTPPQDPKSELELLSTCNDSSETHVSETLPGEEKAHTQVHEFLTSSPLHNPVGAISTSLASDGPRKHQNLEKSYPLESEISGKQVESHALVPHQTSEQVGSMLDRLQQAKLLLRKEITRVPPNGIGFAVKAIEPSFHQSGTSSKVDIPGGFSGLFRLPTDLSLQASDNNFQFLGSSSALAPRLSSTGYSHENGALLTAEDRFTSGLNTRTMPAGSPADDRFFANQFFNSASRAVPEIPKFDPLLPTMFTSYLQHPSNPDLLQMRLPSNGGYFPRLNSNTASAVPPSDNFMFNGNTSQRKMMYR